MVVIKPQGGEMHVTPGSESKMDVLVLEMNGRQYVVGRVELYDDGTIECQLADGIKYNGPFSGYVRGFTFEPPPTERSAP